MRRHGGLCGCGDEVRKLAKELKILSEMSNIITCSIEIANESAIISSTVSDIANNILEDVKKKRF